MSSTTMIVTVTDDSPLQVKVDGADTATSAEKAADVAALSASDRVYIDVRTPKQPLVTGKVA